MGFLDRYFCPGCNAELPANNNGGCAVCGYGVDHGPDSKFPWEHIPPLSWWLTTETIQDNEEMRDVCMGFVRRLLAEIQRMEGKC